MGYVDAHIVPRCRACHALLWRTDTPGWCQPCVDRETRASTYREIEAARWQRERHSLRDYIKSVGLTHLRVEHIVQPGEMHDAPPLDFELVPGLHVAFLMRFQHERGYVFTAYEHAEILETLRTTEDTLLITYKSYRTGEVQTTEYGPGHKPVERIYNLASFYEVKK
jgi:hypothetical protein